MRNFLFLLFLAAGFSVSAQSVDADQNPNYEVSRKKYMKMKDSLLYASNTTIQETYKAYDWYEAKLERKAERRQRRNQMRTMRSLYNYQYSDPYYYPSNHSFFSNFIRYRPYIGYRTGDWFFGF